MKLVATSHQDWQKAVIEQHNLEHPFAPENGESLKFKPGDTILYTNDDGGEFVHTVTSLYKPQPINSLYATGCRYMLDWDCYWMPVRESNLSLIQV